MRTQWSSSHCHSSVMRGPSCAERRERGTAGPGGPAAEDTGRGGARETRCAGRRVSVAAAQDHEDPQHLDVQPHHGPREAEGHAPGVHARPDGLGRAPEGAPFRIRGEVASPRRGAPSAVSQSLPRRIMRIRSTSTYSHTMVTEMPKARRQAYTRGMPESEARWTSSKSITSE